MSFTELHRALGVAPGPLTDELLSEAVAAGVAETDGLDWKSELPPAKGIPQTDFPKDVAAMANSGGGLIVYGVREDQKAAVERVDVGKFDEAHERSLRNAAITAIAPPVFGLNVHRVGAPGSRTVIVEVPSSLDGPHLIYKNDYFAAPVRNDSDTVWMKERQIEAMYRARFEERRHATEVLNALFSEAAAGRNTDTRSWMIAVAHPRMPRFRDRLTREAARDVLSEAEGLALVYAGRGGIHPLESVDRLNPRPGLRRWVAVNTATSDRTIWKEAWASIHDDGSVTLATAVGAHRIQAGHFEGWQVESSAIECAIADLMALIRTTAEATGNDEYDVRVGIVWTGGNPLTILTKDNQGFTYDGVSTPLHHYTPVEMTVNANAPDVDYFWHVHDLAQDCVNQGGISNVLMIRPPARDQE
ncbi:AlbA family DNA-binding domain-containing protein [Mycobacterium avium]|uniref:AlbA family DNA-binding domain-containing protein n=1 Tax=Mycobacterium avium TaxID=1764 RepID=UPI0001B59F41|nr:ATP-binding protein [Mycobacterium avium]ETB14430.1 transcriptional regulator [Mycobacterium avium subsp. avium 10-9275]AYJ06364.1 ATP-binding protein [Mycobacterium avium]MDV3265303.1 ATP-binding protein [Mycobacterium avium]UEA20796.1 ATP-binding protein [Mycobacterium avium subsp. avium]UGU10786.1 ATP-binding protein [Mycobacterium avium subsp. avium]